MQQVCKQSIYVFIQHIYKFFQGSILYFRCITIFAFQKCICQGCRHPPAKTPGSIRRYADFYIDRFCHSFGNVLHNFSHNRFQHSIISYFPRFIPELMCSFMKKRCYHDRYFADFFHRWASHHHNICFFFSTAALMPVFLIQILFLRK